MDGSLCAVASLRNRAPFDSCLDGSLCAVASLRNRAPFDSFGVILSS